MDCDCAAHRGGAGHRQWSGDKDPSVVFYDNRWHVYATLRNENFAHMEYLSFADWPQANAAPRTVVSLIKGYHSAPEIFYFTPQKKWYLIYQCAPVGDGGFYGPVYSTLADVGKPQSLSAPVRLFEKKPANVERWLDFWVICDDSHAYLFFTGDDGRFCAAERRWPIFPASGAIPR